MLSIDEKGRVFNARITLNLKLTIERGTMTQVRGIIVHQTGGATAQSSLSSYLTIGANGAHFLIDKDGKIFQTASLYKQTWHVGKLKARCIAEFKCTSAEIRSLSSFNPKAEDRREMKKSVPDRYPSNADSIGIELVGRVLKQAGADTAANGAYEAVTPAQNASLAWLVQELALTLRVPMAEIFRHPTVSRKNPTEAATAVW